MSASLGEAMIILIFINSMEIFSVDILMVITISLGMVITISIAGINAIYGLRGILSGGAIGDPNYLSITIELLGAALVFGIGLFFLLGEVLS